MTIDFSFKRVTLFAGSDPFAVTTEDGEVISIEGQDHRTLETWGFSVHLSREDARKLVTELQGAVEEADAKLRQVSHAL